MRSIKRLRTKLFRHRAETVTAFSANCRGCLFAQAEHIVRIIRKKSFLPLGNRSKNNFNVCHRCGRWVDSIVYNPDMLMCVNCAPLEEGAKYCKHCGAKANNGDINCFVCGKKLLYGGADENDEI
mgnify:CR=1 FL=1